MPVENTTSPDMDFSAPNEKPEKIEPSSRTSLAFFFNNILKKRSKKIFFINFFVLERRLSNPTKQKPLNNPQIIKKSCQKKREACSLVCRFCFLCWRLFCPTTFLSRCSTFFWQAL